MNDRLFVGGKASRTTQLRIWLRDSRGKSHCWPEASGELLKERIRLHFQCAVLLALPHSFLFISAVLTAYLVLICLPFASAFEEIVLTIGTTRRFCK